MIDLASIRNASFSLTPTGYNPEEVDQFLVELADADPATVDLAHLRNASFTLTPTGYNPEEVDEFLGSIADQLAAAPAPQSEQVEPEHHPAEQAAPALQAVEEHAPAPAGDAWQPVEQPADEEQVEAPITWHEPEEAQHVPAADEQPAAWHAFHHQGDQHAEAPHVEAADADATPEHEHVAQAEELQPIEPAPVASLDEAVPATRDHGDLDGLAATVSSTIAALESLLSGELRAVREASALGVDDIHTERRRLIDEAAEAGRRHLAEIESHAEQILDHARRDAERIRSEAHAATEEERRRFEQALVDREAQAQARAAEIVADAESRRGEAEQLLATAAEAQAAMLASFEQARSSLIQAAERTRIAPADVHAVSPADQDADEHDATAAA